MFTPHNATVGEAGVAKRKERPASLLIVWLGRLSFKFMHLYDLKSVCRCYIWMILVPQNWKIYRKTSLFAQNYGFHWFPAFPETNQLMVFFSHDVFRSTRFAHEVGDSGSKDFGHSKEWPSLKQDWCLFYGIGTENQRPTATNSYVHLDPQDGERLAIQPCFIDMFKKKWAPELAVSPISSLLLSHTRKNKTDKTATSWLMKPFKYRFIHHKSTLL